MNAPNTPEIQSHGGCRTACTMPGASPTATARPPRITAETRAPKAAACRLPMRAPIAPETDACAAPAIPAKNAIVIAMRVADTCLALRGSMMTPGSVCVVAQPLHVLGQPTLERVLRHESEVALDRRDVPRPLAVEVPGSGADLDARPWHEPADHCRGLRQGGPLAAGHVEHRLRSLRRE